MTRVPGYRSRGPGSVPGATRFYENAERGPLSLVNTIEELLERKSIRSGLEIREYGRRDPSRWPRGTLYPQKLALTSPAIGGRSAGIGCSRTQAKEFQFFFVLYGFKSQDLLLKCATISITSSSYTAGANEISEGVVITCAGCNMSRNHPDLTAVPTVP
jgi:hypothetical protein